MNEKLRDEKVLKKQVKFKKDTDSLEHKTPSQTEKQSGAPAIYDITNFRGSKDIRSLKPTVAKLPFPLSDILRNKGDYLEIPEYYYVTDIIIDFLKNLKRGEKGSDAGILGDILLLIVAGIVIGLVYMFLLR